MKRNLSAKTTFVSHYPGHTALTLACHCGHESIVKLLVERGAEVNRGEGLLPLVEACKGGNIAVIELSLNSGARIDAKPHILCHDRLCYENYYYRHGPHYHDDLNAVMVASSNGYSAIVALLLQRGASVAIQLDGLDQQRFDLEGFKALTFACEGYHWDAYRCRL